MKIINAEKIDYALNFESLIKALQKGFASAFCMPKRNVYELNTDKSNHDAFAILPAWNEHVIGVKAFTYFPTNTETEYQSLYSKIMLFSRNHGEPLALVDGTRITLWRTAAVSALASQYLSRKNSKHLVFFGSGNLALYMIKAHISVRNFEKVTLIARNAQKVAVLKHTLEQAFPNMEFVIGKSTKEVVYSADVISCATGSPTPLFKGSWLNQGTHIDLIGNHHSEQRECDSTTIIRSNVYVDSKVNVLAEAGELLLPIKEGVFCAHEICAELSELAIQNKNARLNNKDMTLFKSVGTGLSDLIAAHSAYQLLEG